MKLGLVFLAAAVAACSVNRFLAAADAECVIVRRTDQTLAQDGAAGAIAAGIGDTACLAESEIASLIREHEARADAGASPARPLSAAAPLTAPCGSSEKP